MPVRILLRGHVQEEKFVDLFVRDEKSQKWGDIQIKETQ